MRPRSVLLFLLLQGCVQPVLATVADVTLIADLSKLIPDASLPGSLPIGALPIVTNGVVGPWLALAEGIAAPDSFNVLSLTLSSPSQVRYEWSSSTSDPFILSKPTLDVPKVGVVATDPGTRMELSIDCLGSGEVSFSLKFNFSDPSSGLRNGELSIILRKDCSITSEKESLPPECGFQAMELKAEQYSGADQESSDVGSFRLATYNTHGIFGMEQRRADAIAAALADVDILMLQELFYRSGREAFARSFIEQGTLPYTLKDGLMGPSKATTSGLMIASRWPIVGCGFEEFRNASGVDAGASKGIAGALLHVGGGRLVYSFSTHLQAGGGSTGSDIRIAQMKQAASFIESSINAAVSAGWEREKIAVVVGGDFNTREENGVAPPAMQDALAGLVDLSAVAENVYEVENTLPSAAGPSSSWLTSQAAELQEYCQIFENTPELPACPQGTAFDELSEWVITGVDYLLTYPDGLANVLVETVEKPALCCSAPENNNPDTTRLISLSDHVAVMARVEVKTGWATDSGSAAVDKVSGVCTLRTIMLLPVCLIALCSIVAFMV